jgi:hypothetical protein
MSWRAQGGPAEGQPTEGQRGGRAEGRSRPGQAAARRAGARAAPSTPWAELHCHSSYSFLDGAATPDELVDEAARLGIEVLALTDHDGMYGVPQFAQPRRGLRELRDPVHPVVIGEGEHLKPEPGGLGDEFIRGSRPVEEAVGGMAVQFGPRDARRGLRARPPERGPARTRAVFDGPVFRGTAFRWAAFRGTAFGAP